jgi:PTH1 family peptidyl-tRNA hydrolase
MNHTLGCGFFCPADNPFMIKLLVGLGNPGPEYEQTRHNAGFWLLDAYARALEVSWALDHRFFGLLGRADVSGHKVWLLKPQTFMNQSGQSVGTLARFFKINPNEILVAHDELDLEPGQVKVKFGGGHAGHNGLRDIHAQLGSADYWRFRLGVGHPGDKSQVLGWVLKKPAQAHHEAIEAGMARCVLAMPDVLDGRMEKATALIHATKPERPKPLRHDPATASKTAP